MNLLLSLASALLMLGGLELGARWADPKTPLLLLPAAANCLRRSPSLSLELRPSCAGDLSGTPVSTNALGMRGPEVRDDGSIRILTLGDSCTFGWRVRQDETYPAILQTRLDGRPGGQRYQVLNGGVPGYTSHHGVVALREKGLALAPAIVIIGFGFNDANERGDVEEQIAFERRFLPFIRIDDLLLQRSTLYRWARWRTADLPRGEMESGRAESGAPRPEQPRAAGDRKGPGPRVSLEKYISNLEEMVVSTRDHGAQPILLSFWPAGGGRAGRRMALTIVADKWDVPLISYEGPRVDIVHPTAEGYRQLAERIQTVLGENGMLKGSPAGE